GGRDVAVAGAAGDPAERLRARAQEGGSEMVLEAGQRLGQLRGDARLRGRGGDLADGALLQPDGGGVDEPEPVDGPPAGPEGLAQHLQPGAHAEDGTSCPGGAGEATVGDEMLGRECLGGVLAAAEAVD